MFDDVANAAARVELAWSRTVFGLLTLAGTVVLVSAHRDELTVGLICAAWLASIATLLAVRQRVRSRAEPGRTDRVQMLLTTCGTTVAALFALLLVVAH